MPLVKNTITGNNYLVKINTDGDSCSRTAIRSYDLQYGSGGSNGNTRFYLPWSYSPSSHTLWVFVNGNKAIAKQTATTNRQYKELSIRSVEFGNSLGDTDTIEFIVAGSYLSETDTGAGGFTWILTDEGMDVSNNYGYMTDTNTIGPVTFVLPADPAEGETFSVVDAFGTFGTNNATLDRNGKNILGLAENFVFDRDGQAAQFVYDGIDNWIIVTEIGVLSGADGEWITVTSATNADTFGKYMADTDTVGAFTITLPLNPVANDSVTVSDYAGTFSTANCTIGRNGQNIMGVADDFSLNVNDITVKFTYIDATQGWRVVSVSS